ncbi:polysaccharide deacetylase family protein [Pontibacillus yanchengensis]|uniref:Polysaccharide deacetylase family protein n=2 Tax=Pontibacillus yanchengensis TaxID=462910 RepID=A0ACC7VBQ9_9BACI|nr:polysaccharide deacetylase family protein [Pontibacillus yanchengensis]MYL32978.1 polysaccharide deacetylase family protein [Pontibacillus yanchengensis]MYL52172.1 polysaccharide deacetylase family protein [Pontibacillus yanchengensis]
MRKTISLLILIFVLTACGQNQTTSGNTNENQDGNTTPEDTQNASSSSSDQQTDESVDNKGQNKESSSKEEVNEEENNNVLEDKENNVKGEEVSNEPVEPKYEITESWDIKPIGDAEKKVVLLTIDDAPDKHALDMAKTLKGLDAPAIFFVNGHFIDTEEEKETLKKIHEMGFVIGNHTMDHKNLRNLTKEEQQEQIVPLSDRIEEVIGERPVFFRAPHGANTDYSTQTSLEENMLVMNWTYGYDWNQEYMSEEAIADIMVNTNLLHSGANLLMHDREWTAKALDDIVKRLREKGYSFVRPEEIKTP